MTSIATANLYAKTNRYKLNTTIFYWDANSKYIAIINDLNEISIYSSNTFKNILTQQDIYVNANHIQFHPKYFDIFCVTLSNSQVYLYFIDTKNNKLEAKVKYYCSNNINLYKTIFSPYGTGKYLATISSSDIKIWNICKYDNYYNINIKPILNMLINFQFKWSKSGEYLIYPKTPFKIEVFSLTSKTIIFHLQITAKSCYFLENSNEIIILNDSNISIWNPKTNKEEFNMEYNGNNIKHSDIDYENSLLYLYDTKTLSIFDLKEKKEKFSYGISKHINFSLLKRPIKDLSLFSKIIFFNQEDTFESLEIFSKSNIVQSLNEEEAIKDFWNNSIPEIKNNYEYLSNLYNYIEKDEIKKKKYLSIQKIIDEINNVLENKTLEERRIMVIKDITNLNENENINISDMYINFIKNIIKDNTNKNLLTKYLIFLKNNEEKLNEIYKEFFETFNDEISQFEFCFTKDELKNKINYSKNNSEKERLLEFLNELIKIKDFSEVENFINKRKKELDNFRFNQRIFFENNEELYFSRCRIVLIYNLEKIVKKNKNKMWKDMKYCINEVLKRKFIDNIEIIKSKNSITSILILMAVPQSEIITNYNLNLIDNNNVNTTKNDLLTLGFKHDDLNQAYEKDNIVIKDSDISSYNLKNLNLYINLQSDDKKKFKQYELYKYDNLVNYYNDIFDEDKIKNFLCKILKSNVIKEAFSFFYGSNIKYPFSESKSEEYYLQNLLKFIPLKNETSDGVTEKFSMETYIFLNKKLDIYNNLNDTEKNLSSKEKLISKALINGAIVEIHFHELNHNFHNYYYCLENGNESLKTPRKQALDEREGGNNMEKILFGRVLNDLTLRQALYILNENNYKKSLNQFREDFLKMKDDYFECEGVFQEYSILKSEVADSSDYMSIRFKISSNNIKFKIKDDVLGFPNFNEETSE